MGALDFVPLRLIMRERVVSWRRRSTERRPALSSPSRRWEHKARCRHPCRLFSELKVSFKIGNSKSTIKLVVLNASLDGCLPSRKVNNVNGCWTIHPQPIDVYFPVFVDQSRKFLQHRWTHFVVWYSAEVTPRRVGSGRRRHLRRSSEDGNNCRHWRIVQASPLLVHRCRKPCWQRATLWEVCCSERRGVSPSTH